MIFEDVLIAGSKGFDTGMGWSIENKNVAFKDILPLSINFGTVAYGVIEMQHENGEIRAKIRIDPIHDRAVVKLCLAKRAYPKVRLLINGEKAVIMGVSLSHNHTDDTVPCLDIEKAKYV